MEATISVDEIAEFMGAMRDMTSDQRIMAVLMIKLVFAVDRLTEVTKLGKT